MQRAHRIRDGTQGQIRFLGRGTMLAKSDPAMKTNQVCSRVAGGIAATMLLVTAGCMHNTTYERTTGEYFDDQQLDRRVSHALNNQPVYKFPDVHVHAYRGVVQLSGFVATEQQKAAATEIAERVRGVDRIENSITLAPLAVDTLRDYIPGRGGSDTNGAIGAPGRNTGIQTQGETNNISPRRTDEVR